MCIPWFVFAYSKKLIPREAEGYSVEFFGLSVRLSHPWRGPLRHVCGHTYHPTTMIPVFLESPSNLDVHHRIRFSIFEIISPELASKSIYYTAMSCSRRGQLRYVCGQTIKPTARICTYLESPTDLDVHLRKRFALFCQNRRNWRRRSRHQQQRNLLVAAELFTLQLCFQHLLHLFTLFGTRGITYAWAT